MGALELMAYFGAILMLLFFSLLMVVNWKQNNVLKKRIIVDTLFIVAGFSLAIVTGISQQLFMLVIFGLFLMAFLLKYQANKAAAFQGK